MPSPAGPRRRLVPRVGTIEDRVGLIEDRMTDYERQPPKMTAAKAFLAFLIAGVGSLAVAAVDNGISLAEGLTAASVALIALGGVYGVKNAPSAP